MEVALINTWYQYLEGIGSSALIPPVIFSAEELILSRSATGANLLFQLT